MIVAENQKNLAEVRQRQLELKNSTFKPKSLLVLPSMASQGVYTDYAEFDQSFPNHAPPDLTNMAQPINTPMVSPDRDNDESTDKDYDNDTDIQFEDCEE